MALPQHKTLTSIIYIFSVLPILIGLLYIIKYAVNVPNWDQWGIEVPLLRHFFEGTLNFSDFIGQANESRPFFPRIAMLIIALATKFNTIYEMLFMYLLYCLSLLVLFLMYLRDHKINMTSLLVFVPVIWSYLNLYQMSNMLYGVRILQAMTILFFFISVYLIDTSKALDRRFAFSIIAAIVATFSFVAGITVWPACFIQIILNKNTFKVKKLFIWTMSGIMVILFYTTNYVKPSSHPALDYSLSHISESILFFFASVGSSTVRDPELSPIIGVIIIIAFLLIIILIRSDGALASNSTWITLFIFSIIISLEMTVARSGFGSINVAISQRYFLFTFLNIICLYVLILNTLIMQIKERDYCLNLKDEKIVLRCLLLLIVTALIMVGGAFDFQEGLKEGRVTKEVREDLVYYLNTYEIQPDKIIIKFLPTANTVRDRASFLKKYGLSVFAKEDIDLNNITESKSPILYTIESINSVDLKRNSTIKVSNLDKDSVITITGWAVDEKANMPAKAVFISLDNTFNISSRYGLDRIDVSRVYNNANYRYSGFKSSFAAAALENGTRNLTIKVIANNGKEYYHMDSKIKFEVGN